VLFRSIKKINFKKFKLLSVIQSSIKTKLLLAYAIPLVAIIILGLFSYNMSRKEIESMSLTASEESVTNQLKLFQSIADNIDNISRQVMSSTDVVNYLMPPGKDESVTELQKRQTNVTLLMSSLASGSRYVKTISVIGKEKTFSTNSYLQNTLLSDLEGTYYYENVFKGTAKSLWISNPQDINPLYKGRGEYKGPVLFYVRLIVNLQEQEPIGLALIELKADVATEILSSLQSTEGDLVHMITTDGFDVSQVPAEGSTANVSNSGFSQSNLYQAIMASEKELETQLDGDYVSVAGKMGNTGVVISKETPKKILFAPANNIMLATGLIGLISILLSGFIAFTMSNSMSKAIHQVSQCAGQAAAGDLTVIPAVNRSDELGRLTKNIASMIDNMRRLIQDAVTTADSVFNASMEGITSNTRVIEISQDIAKAVTEIASGATSQAQDAESGVQMAQELAKRIQGVSESTKVIDKVSNQTFELTRSGLSAIEELDITSKQTNQIITEVSHDIHELSEGSKKIGSIIKVISGVAEQSHLLSINATIEAARAGEMGRGFAVVAEEVSKLANQTAQSAREIAQIIAENQQQTEKAAKKTMEAEGSLVQQNSARVNAIKAFNEIWDSMDNLIKGLADIVSSIAEMENYKDQVVSSISNISAVSQETAATTQEVEASCTQQTYDLGLFKEKAHALEAQAKSLKEAIKIFKL
jgi:methyl-accepting chemotaxis protein